MKSIFRVIGIVLLLAALNTPTFGQGWLREWISHYSSTMYDVENAMNGDFIMAAENNGSSSLGPAYFVRMSPNGDTLWTQYVTGFRIEEIELIDNDTIVGVGAYLGDPAFIKLDAAGNLINIKVYSNLNVNLRKLKKTTNHELVVMGAFGSNFVMISNLQAYYVDSLSVLKLDTEGNILWTQNHPKAFIEAYHRDYAGREITPTSDGGFVIAATRFSEINSIVETKAYLVKLNAAGSIVWEQDLNLSSSISCAFSVKETADGGYILSGRDGFNSVIIKTNSTGIIQWTTTIFTPPVTPSYQVYWNSRDVIQDSDGNYLATGSFQGAGGNNDGDSLMLYKLNPQGVVLWSQGVVGRYGLGYRGNKVKETSDGGYVIVGIGTDFAISNWMFICKVDSNGRVTTTAIEGNVYADLNDDCDWDAPLEYPLTNWVVTATGNNGQVYYANTDTAGYYNIEAEMGTYDVTLSIPYPYWDTVCVGLGTVVLNTVNQVSIVDFPVQASIPCPLLNVDISAPFLRLCFPSYYVVQYCNWGAAAAQNAYVEVELDTFMSYDSSSVAATHLGGNLYRFDLGTVSPGHCGTFNIDINILCDTTLAGITHCSEARIYPDTNCQSSWNGPNIVLDGHCLGDSILFQVANTGGSMVSSLRYDIFEDNVMMRTGGYQLGTGQVETIYVPTQNGSTYRLEARQVPTFPPLLGDTLAGLALEGCRVDSLGNIVTGFVTQFSNYDGSPFTDVDCQPNIGSYDPNDKLAYPVGYGAEHYIYDHTDLEYYIRFQNTGTDTAFKVVLIDSISSHLDIGSLRVGASSHDYTYEIYGNGVVKFTFDNILLPDSTTNNSASQGFVKYRIEQRANNPIGTIINNNADIYFDYNAPVRTNTTFHEIGSDFVTIQLVGTERIMEPGVLVNVYPNPFNEVARVEIEGKDFTTIEFELYDLTGRVVYQKTTNETSFDLYKSDLSQGVYVYRIVADGKLLNTGKLIAR
ncbi:MAG: Unknown protein [uncultured Aureispira sp.]|uniref:Uncharacterized protein n=1 Tax=uncultured Aureispira sp. TaxID=1331704 RepID=A0A6S6THS3_9BACT|nr:MAG: Unknown protein [uncultured Aureispira sp.]